MTIIAPDLAVARKREVWRLMQDSGGAVTPEQVVAVAASPDNPLHDLFEWDDSEAARRFRLVQAGDYLRAIRVYVTRRDTAPKRVTVSLLKPLDATAENTRTTRGLVSLRSERGEGVYRSLAEVLETPELRAQMVGDAASEAKAWRMRYRDLHELADVFTAIDQLCGCQCRCRRRCEHGRRGVAQ